MVPALLVRALSVSGKPIHVLIKVIEALRKASSDALPQVFMVFAMLGTRSEYWSKLLLGSHGVSTLMQPLARPGCREVALEASTRIYQWCVDRAKSLGLIREALSGEQVAFRLDHPELKASYVLVRQMIEARSYIGQLHHMIGDIQTAIEHMSWCLDAIVKLSGPCISAGNARNMLVATQSNLGLMHMSAGHFPVAL